MTNYDREEYQRLLETKEAELAGGLAKRDHIAVERVADEVDEMRLAEDRDLVVHDLDRQTALLRQVREARERLRGGNYGICLRCDDEISRKRLSAVPWAAYCRDCQDAVDKGIPDHFAEPVTASSASSGASALVRRTLPDAA